MQIGCYLITIPASTFVTKTTQINNHTIPSSCPSSVVSLLHFFIPSTNNCTPPMTSSDSTTQPLLGRCGRMLWISSPDHLQFGIKRIQKLLPCQMHKERWLHLLRLLRNPSDGPILRVEDGVHGIDPRGVRLLHRNNR